MKTMPHQPEDWLAVVMGAFRFRIEGVIAQCESPIEVSMLLALSLSTGMEWTWGSELDAGHQWNFAFAWDPTTLDRIYNQYRVEINGHQYRLDFAVLDDDGIKIAIEVDGHDFHERTKEQAARDKARDRALVSDGWIVLRFTGSEVYRDAAKCAGEVLDLLHSVSSARQASASAFASKGGAR